MRARSSHLRRDGSGYPTLNIKVYTDEIIELTAKECTTTCKLKLRKIRFYDWVLKREFGFLTNLFEMRPDLVAVIYKLRWQIELLFRQIKQNFPLKYFPGDNENAIKIQIYCTLIANLLMTVIQSRLKRSWAFSNLVSFCKIHLFNYIQLLIFLKIPIKIGRKPSLWPGSQLFLRGLTFKND